jgi:putative tryptophan/tyrosine transport system substrate-binding protein
MIRRREVITLLASAATWPLAARAQQPVIPVIGYFSARSPDAEAPLRVPFLKALEEWGFVAGRNVAIEYRFAEGRDELLPGLAAELVRRQVAMLVATDRPSALAAKAATATIPIVVPQWVRPGPAWSCRQPSPTGRHRHRCKRVLDRAWTKALGTRARTIA